jgi:hypothetical protein
VAPVLHCSSSPRTADIVAPKQSRYKPAIPNDYAITPTDTLRKIFQTLNNGTTTHYEKAIAPAPIHMLAQFIDVDTGEVSLGLAWRRHDWHDHVVGRGEVMNSHRTAAFGPLGSEKYGNPAVNLWGNPVVRLIRPPGTL